MNVATGRSLIVWIVLGVCALGPGTATGASAPGARPMQVAVSGAHISARLDEGPRVEVLEEIARQSGIRVVVHGDLGAVRPQTFDRLSLTEGIRRVVGDHALMTIHSGGRLATVLVRARSAGGSRTPPPVLGAPAAESSPSPGSGPYLDDRRSAIAALVHRGGVAGVRGLSRMLQEDPDPTVRRLATNALLNLSATSSLDTALRTQAARAFGSALDDERTEVRLEAVRGLGLVHGHVANPRLARAATSDPAPEIRRQALSLLARSKSSMVRATLERSMADPDPEVRETAARLVREEARGPRTVDLAVGDR